MVLQLHKSLSLDGLGCFWFGHIFVKCDWEMALVCICKESSKTRIELVKRWQASCWYFCLWTCGLSSEKSQLWVLCHSSLFTDWVQVPENVKFEKCDSDWGKSWSTSCTMPITWAPSGTSLFRFGTLWIYCLDLRLVGGPSLALQPWRYATVSN